ncbi:YhcN/YlaJ family sporulation lipoprotein [Neobacillus ginsengisoli]|uniref:Phage anti-repressor protein n=1 Tax=Neobacillus ginsengisoli TaxID=904295 RepID=A0ABT9XTC8_9BACI|nr:YhcN/YlaJ family sporulation lipoprotein [Neobacillus ginsengisoli]MDQ0198209.1 phage anti-repressor protein [Neobacillus ginsengisoli]
MVYLNRLILFVCLLLLTACGSNQKVKDSQLALIKTTNPSPVVTDKNKNPNHVEEIKKDVSSFPEIYDVAVVKGKNNTLVAYKVKHMQRFRMLGIEKKVNKLLEERYPKENFTVSSDYKIFLEAVRLDERIKERKYSTKQAEKQLRKIIKMTKDMT